MKKICMWLVIGVAATGMAGVASAQELPPGPMPVPTVKVGPASGGKSGESGSKRCGKKSGTKDEHRSGAGVGACFRAFGILDGHGGP